MIAAQAALAAGENERAAEHAREALALAPHVDPWTDDKGSVWVETAAALRAAGRAVDADAALASGRAWVADGATALTEVTDRTAWWDGHPLHRALRAGP